MVFSKILLVKISIYSHSNYGYLNLLIMSKVFYIYYHIDPRNNEIRYIGKGSGRRAWAFHRGRGHHRNWINKLKSLGMKPLVKIVEYLECEIEAYAKEKLLIKIEKEKGTSLCNISEGGNCGPRLSGKNNAMYGKSRPDLAKRNKKNKGKSLEEIYGKEKANKIKISLSKSLEEKLGYKRAEIVRRKISKKSKEMFKTEKGKAFLEKRIKRVKGKTWEEIYGKEKAKEMRKNHKNINKKSWIELYGKEKAEKMKTETSKRLKQKICIKVSDGSNIWPSIKDFCEFLGRPKSQDHIAKTIRKGKKINDILYYLC